MTPKSAAERRYRDGVLALATDFPFARVLLNAGRLSRPCSLKGIGLQADAERGAEPSAGRDADPLPDGERAPASADRPEVNVRPIEPGTPCPDAPVLLPDGSAGWLLNALGPGFTLLIFAGSVDDAPASVQAMALVVVARSGPPRPGTLVDRDGLAHSRYGARPGTTFLIRPDQHVAARFERFDPDSVAAALPRATGRDVSAARLAA